MKKGVDDGFEFAWIVMCEGVGVRSFREIMCEERGFGNRGVLKSTSRRGGKAFPVCSFCVLSCWCGGVQFVSICGR